MKKESLNDYLNSVTKKLSGRKVISRSFSDINEFPLTKGQCLYILDFKKKTVAFQKRVTELLGYSPEEFNFELPMNFFHPDDYDIVTRLIKATVMFSIDNDVTRDLSFFLTYRARHKNGGYVKVLRQTYIYESDVNGKVISNLSVLSDISFLSTSNKVDWRFDAPGLDKEKFKKYVTKEYEDFFSGRELDIIKQLKLGLKSKEIGEKLHISKHTVDTHRRTILRKSNCKNTIDLLNFCNQNGLV
jgi:DNA-binding CsgD family transcriptional regulator